ncbi:DUF4097 family beta strand repeat-containing protein [Paraglaciecola sp. 2405UD69-4]|uniref:DUF4097 family beta strand repeat-containing protein n=1 Tax=Paraglaciecola sp. 2405UD69-4 TaxID=3391836 RepID=UPI0039C9CE5A
MKKLIMGVLLSCVAVTAWAGEQIDRIADVDQDAFIKIEHVNGKANIKGWDKNQVRVVGTLGDNTEEFIFKHDNDEVMIEVKVKKHRKWDSWGDDEGDILDIYVPRLSKVYYSAINADVDIEGVQGGASIDTVNGSINSRALAGRIHLESVNGDISAKELIGDVKIETVNGDINSVSSGGNGDSYDSVNGDIKVVSKSQEINVGTVNGDIELELGDVSQLSVSTVNGDIEANLSLLKSGDIEAYSVDGGINLYFQKQVSARFDIQAHAGGSIKNLLSDDKMQKAKYGPSRWLEFSLNGGHAEVDVSTVSGKVKLSTK